MTWRTRLLHLLGVEVDRRVRQLPVDQDRRTTTTLREARIEARRARKLREQVTHLSEYTGLESARRALEKGDAPQPEDRG